MTSAHTDLTNAKNQLAEAHQQFSFWQRRAKGIQEQATTAGSSLASWLAGLTLTTPPQAGKTHGPIVGDLGGIPIPIGGLPGEPGWPLPGDWKPPKGDPGWPLPGDWKPPKGDPGWPWDGGRPTVHHDKGEVSGDEGNGNPNPGDRHEGGTAEPVSRPDPELTEEGLEHIKDGHFPGSNTPNAGKFAPGTTEQDLESEIEEAVKNGTERPNTNGRPGTIYEDDLGHTIGTNSKGQPTSRIRVVLSPNGTVITAFPY